MEEIKTAPGEAIIFILLVIGFFWVMILGLVYALVSKVVAKGWKSAKRFF